MSKKASLREHRTGRKAKRVHGATDSHLRLHDEGKRGGKREQANRSKVKIDLNR